MSTPTNEQREAEVRERLAKAASGPWSWSRTYEMAGVDGRLHKHWCLNNPDFAKKGQCIDGFLVTETTADADFGSRPLDQTPNFALIANAPSDLSWLLSRIEELAKERDAANAILEELETLTGFTQTALVDEWLCVSKDAERLDWLDVPGIEHGRIAKVSAAMLDGATTVREAIDVAMSAASSSGANTP